MSLPASLDPDLLRTFCFIADEGSFTRAAELVGRTQSAVSMQVQRLETLLGQRLLARGKGGAVTLTPHGEYLLGRAREMLALNDEIWSSFRKPMVQGTVRLGTPDDYALRYLPQILKRFADRFPAVEVDVLCLPSSSLIGKLRHGELDLTLCSEGHEISRWPSTVLWRGPLAWVTSTRHSPHRQDPLPIAVAAEDDASGVGSCSWRKAAIEALEKAGRPYRIAYRSATHVGTHVPVMAGLAVTVSTTSWLPEGLRVVRPEEGLPPLPDYGILLLKGRTATQPVTDALATHIIETFTREVASSLPVAA